ncbi:MAG TPA: hypothetical protein PLH94_06815 [Fimbriimonadaceae bacterium]|nr:hypothetical protein [Fimbriimonadaceae bacterium]
MKKDLSNGTVVLVAAVALVVIVGLGFVWMNRATSSSSANDAQLEKMHSEQAQSEYGRYTNPDAGQSGTAPTGGPPVSGEGAAQAQFPAGQKAGN